MKSANLTSENFGTNQGLKNAGILYVFQALQTAELGQKIYWEKKAIHLAVTKAEQGNPVQNRNTVGCPLCCKHEVCSFSAKAGHWGNLRRRGTGVEKFSEHVSQKTYELCVLAQLKHTYRLMRYEPAGPL